MNNEADNNEQEFLEQCRPLYLELHDAQVAKAEREKVLKELIEWLEPQNLMLLKQKTYRKLQSLRAQQQGGVSES